MTEEAFAAGVGSLRDERTVDLATSRWCAAHVRASRSCRTTPRGASTTRRSSGCSTPTAASPRRSSRRSSSTAARGDPLGAPARRAAGLDDAEAAACTPRRRHACGGSSDAQPLASGSRPVAKVAPGRSRLETADGLDGQLTRESSHADAGTLDLGLGHPLTGPVFVVGRGAGRPARGRAARATRPTTSAPPRHPGLRLPRRPLHRPVPRQVGDRRRLARSAELPGIAVPEDAFAGVIGVAPSRERLEEFRRREEAFARPRPPGRGLAAGGGGPPEAATVCGRSRRVSSAGTWMSASSSPAAGCGCRSTCRARCSRSATSTSPRATARSAVRRSRSRARSRCASGCRTARRQALPHVRDAGRPARSSFATTGIPVEAGMDMNVAAREALLEMIDHLEASTGSPGPRPTRCAAPPSTSGSPRSWTCPTPSSRRCSRSTCSTPPRSIRCRKHSDVAARWHFLVPGPGRSLDANVLRRLRGEEPDQLAARADVQLAKDAAQVELDCFRAQEQSSSHVAVG